MTLTAPVRGSSATTAPLRPASWSKATFCALGSSVVRIASPSLRLPENWSTRELSVAVLAAELVVARALEADELAAGHVGVADRMGEQRRPWDRSA